MILQSVGDVSGRMLAPTSKCLVRRKVVSLADVIVQELILLRHKNAALRSGPLQKKLPLLGGMVLPTCFVVLVLAAIVPWIAATIAAAICKPYPAFDPRSAEDNNAVSHFISYEYAPQLRLEQARWQDVHLLMLVKSLNFHSMACFPLPTGVCKHWSTT